MPTTYVAGSSVVHLDDPAQLHPAVSPADQTLAAIEVLKCFGSSGALTLDDDSAAALSLLYERYAAMVRGVAGRILKSYSDAEDILHDVFAALPWSIARYANGGFGGWLRQVATRCALMRLRRANRVDHVDPVPDVVDDRIAECDFEALLDREALGPAIGQLPIPFREVVVLRFFLDLTHDEIGDILEITRNASEVRLCRALKHLRVTLRRKVISRPACSP